MTSESPALPQLLDVVREMGDAALTTVEQHGDHRDGLVYAVTPEIRTAVQVALITSRPLLLSGPPGCGKSSLAAFLARALSFSYLEYVVTDASNPRELLFRFDVIRRLNDAQLKKIRDGRDGILDYVDPGPLWWALNPDSAACRGNDSAGPPSTRAVQPDLLDDHTAQWPGTVVLIDEIDKADSSFCNSLLVPLGSKVFAVDEADLKVPRSPDVPEYSPLIVITTNNERDLPEPFVRRCVALPIERPDADRLLEIAELHFPPLRSDESLSRKVREIVKRFNVIVDGGVNASTAEFLDLVATFLSLNTELDSDDWKLIERLVIEKPEVRSQSILRW